MSPQNNTHQRHLCEEERFLPEQEYCEVVVSYVDEGEVWVWKRSEEQTLTTISNEIKSLMPTDTETLQVSQVIAVLNVDDAWYRARVLALKPEIVVRFIDYGDTRVVSLNEIAPLPSSLHDYPPLAMKVALPSDHDLKLSEGLKMVLKTLKRDGDLTTVEIVEDENAHPDLYKKPRTREILECNSQDLGFVNNIEVGEESGLSKSIDIGEPLSTEDSQKQHSTNLDIRNESEPTESSGATTECNSTSISRNSDCALSPIYFENETNGKDNNEQSIHSDSQIMLKTDDVVERGLEIVEEDISKTQSEAENIIHPSMLNNEDSSALMKNVEFIRDGVKQETDLRPKSGTSNKSDANVCPVVEEHGYKHESERTVSSDDCPAMLGKNCPANQVVEDQQVPYDSFTSALECYPHLGGGYGSAHRDASSVNQDSHPKDEGRENNINFPLINSQRTPQVQTYALKNRGSQGHKSTWVTGPQNNFRPNQPKGLQAGGSHKPSALSSSDLSTEFKRMLDFELSIIREQNRLQMLQIQKKMDDQYSALHKQVNDLRDDVARRLSASHNDVNSRLLMINDSLVQKVAQFYNDLDSIKNHFEIKDSEFSHQRHQDQSPSQDHVPPNRLMARRKQKMGEMGQLKEDPAQQQMSKFANYQPNGKNGDQSHGFSKMDHFDPQSATVVEAQSSNKNGCIVSVCHLDPEKVNPDLLFNLFGLYGNVLRVKISLQDKEKAYVEMADSAQTEAVVQYLDGIPFLGRNIRVSHCPFTQLKLSRQEFQCNTCKDYSKPTLQKFQRFKPGSWNAQKLHPPSDTLLISNILRSVPDEKIKEEFAKNSFHVVNISSQNSMNEEKKYSFVTFGSVSEAVNALAVMHHKEMSDWMTMRISFARSDKRFNMN